MADDVELAWTHIEPTVPGWYWMRDRHGTVECVFVVRMPGGLSYLEAGADGWTYIGDPTEYWYGPLIPPV